MATGWEVYPVEFNGGLVSNLSRLQHGVKSPGSARVLINFEPSVKGGYRRINGFSKSDDVPVPSLGSSVVQGSGQSGTTLVVGNLQASPEPGDTFTIAGVSGTYTVASGGVVYTSVNKEATLTLTTSLSSSPVDKADLTWDNRTSKIEGLHYFYRTNTQSGENLVVRDGVIYRGEGSGWTSVSAPDYGTVVVSGAAQTGTTLNVSGITSDTYVPVVGDTFTINGVELVYTVVDPSPTITSGSGSIGVYPALDTSPADGASITFLSTNLTNGTKVRFDNFNFSGTEKTVFVDGTNYPKVYQTGSPLVTLTGSSDLIGSSTVAIFKDHMFLGSGSKLLFSAPFDESDYNPGNGAGAIQLPADVTGLIVFRDRLIIFTLGSIHQLSGSSQADFTLTDISKDLGCSETDTIREVGGDVLFLGPDGLRFLGATARIGDVNLSLASRSIQDNVTQFLQEVGDITSLVIRGKSQYRIMGFSEGGVEATTSGFIGTQFTDQEAGGFAWGQTKGIKAYRSSSVSIGDSEVIQFVGETGYVYTLDTGNTFDGTTIEASFFTPFMTIEDPRIRKTMFKTTTYYDPEGNISGNLTFKYDFQRPDVIQPLSGGGTFSVFGESIFGDVEYGGDPETVIETLTTGSFFTVSLQYEFDTPGDPPFIIDTAIIEYSVNDRK